jgi:hypothetical protein
MMVAILVLLVLAFLATFVVDRVRRRRWKAAAGDGLHRPEDLPEAQDGMGQPLGAALIYRESIDGFGGG